MKTLHDISRMVLTALVALVMVTNLESQNAYRGFSFEDGIYKIHQSVNHLIENGMMKSNPKKSVSLPETPFLSAESELNSFVDLLAERNAKFDINNTISVVEANEENSELNWLTNELVENARFDANQTILVTEADAENSPVNQMTNELMDNIKFIPDQTILVTEANDENSELNQLTIDLMDNVKFDAGNTLLLQNEQTDLSF
jgi:hypothetical protein